MFLVRPPTLREALEIFAVRPGVEDFDETDIEVFRETLEGWLPEGLRSELHELPLGAQLQVVLRILHEGVDMDALRSEGERKNGADDGKESGEPDWALLVGDYCDVWGGEPWEIYNTVPWPFFATMLARKDAGEARASLRRLDENTLPQASGKSRKEILARLKRTAKGPRDQPKAEVDPTTYEPSPDIIREREELRAMMGKKPSVEA